MREKKLKQQLSDTKKQLVTGGKNLKKSAVNSSQKLEQNSSSKSNFNMMVLGGFITALGIVAVAVAFTVLNAASFGIAGIILASIGAAATLVGLGLFGRGAYKKLTANSDISLDQSASIKLKTS